MPDLSDTVAKCRMGTAKKFYTSIASLSHMSKVTGYQAAYVRRGHYHCGADGDSTALHTVLIRDSPSWVESLTRSLIS